MLSALKQFFSDKARKPSDHVEEQIYDTFSSNEDQSLMDRFHVLDWRHRVPLLDQITDERLRLLGQRLFYEEAPNVMTEVTRREYETAMARRFMGADGYAVANFSQGDRRSGWIARGRQ